ncbi:MAG: ATP-binding protein [Bacillota bacterium]
MSNLYGSLSAERAKRREARIRQRLQERDQREAAIMARIPRLREIKEEMAALGLQLARRALGMPAADAEELLARGQALAREREELLRQHGIDPAELEVQWDCPDCQDTGWIQPRVEPGQDVAPPPRKCHCLLQEEIADLYRISGLTQPMREQTFDRFDLTVYPPEDRPYMAEILRQCQEFARAVAAGEKVTHNLILMGGVGLGKTFLATAITNAVVQHHRVAVYFTFPELADVLRRQRFEDDEGGRWGMQLLLESDLLVLDDLGAEKPSDFVVEQLFNVLNHRINRQLPWVVSTNLSLAELGEIYGDRIFSRLVGLSEVLLLRGSDVRLVLRERRLTRK